METVLSEIPALRNFYKSSSISEELMYASDEEVLKKAKDAYTFWKKVEDPDGLYISIKDDENSPVVKLGNMKTIDACPFRNKALIQKARKTLANLRFEELMKNYEELLASTKSEKKKKALVKPTFEEAFLFVFELTDYEVFQTLEYNDYFVFEQKESLTGYEGEGQEILLKVVRDLPW